MQSQFQKKSLFLFLLRKVPRTFRIIKHDLKLFSFYSFRKCKVRIVLYCKREYYADFYNPNPLLNVNVPKLGIII